MTTKSKTTEGRRWGDTPSFEGVVAESRETLDSLVDAATVAARGCGAIGDAWAAFARESMEAQAEAAKAALGARDWTELADAQAAHAKASFARAASAGKRIAETSAKTAEDALAPVRARAGRFVERALGAAA